MNIVLKKFMRKGEGKKKRARETQRERRGRGETGRPEGSHDVASVKNSLQTEVHRSLQIGPF